jgi:hypothetical protein
MNNKNRRKSRWLSRGSLSMTLPQRRVRAKKEKQYFKESEWGRTLNISKGERALSSMESQKEPWQKNKAIVLFVVLGKLFLNYSPKHWNGRDAKLFLWGQHCSYKTKTKDTVKKKKENYRVISLMTQMWKLLTKH